MLVGIHPTTISDSFQTAAAKSAEILEGMSTPVELTDRESLLQSATTALNSKVCDTSLCVSPFLYLGLTVLPSAAWRRSDLSSFFLICVS